VCEWPCGLPRGASYQGEIRLTTKYDAPVTFGRASVTGPGSRPHAAQSATARRALRTSEVAESRESGFARAASIFCASLSGAGPSGVRVVMP
jgi:hypothetical protein